MCNANGDPLWRMPIDAFVTDVQAFAIPVEQFPKRLFGKVPLGICVTGKIAKWHYPWCAELDWCTNLSMLKGKSSQDL